MKPKPMPTKIKVGPHVYSVIRKPKSVMGESNGYCRANELQILIQKGLRRSKAKEILVHELLHACTYPVLIQGGKYDDEEFITSMTSPILQIIQDNPEFIEYLTQ